MWFSQSCSYHVCFMRILKPSGQVEGTGRCRLLLPTPQIMAEESTSLYGISPVRSSHNTTPNDLNRKHFCLHSKEFWAYIIHKKLSCKQSQLGDTSRASTEILNAWHSGTRTKCLLFPTRVHCGSLPEPSRPPYQQMTSWCSYRSALWMSRSPRSSQHRYEWLTR